MKKEFLQISDFDCFLRILTESKIDFLLESKLDCYKVVVDGEVIEFSLSDELISKIFDQ